MKLSIYLLGAAAAALSLGACSQDDARPEPATGYRLTFTVAEDDTRTTLVSQDVLRWMPSDRVGIYTVGVNRNPNTLTVADVNQTPVEFIGILKQMVSPGDKFYAYYPYNAAQSADPAAVTLSIPAAQSQEKANIYNGETNPLVALPMEFPGVEDSYACRMSSVRFKQLGAIIELQLYCSDPTLRSEAIRSVSFEADASIAGEFPFDLTSVTAKGELAISGYESETATVALEQPAAIPADKEDGARVYLTIAPGTYSGSIVVKTDVAHYTFKLAKPLTFERAVIKGMPADLARAERKEIVPINQLWYTTTDGEVAPVAESENSLIESNVYTNGKGVITFKNPVNEIPSFLFGQISNESRITGIRLPECISKIGAYAFFHCQNLVDISIPDNVEQIEYAAFGGCTKLQSINIPENVTTIGGSAFGYCSELKYFDCPYTSNDHRCLIIDNRLCGFAPAGLDWSTYDKYVYHIDAIIIGEGAFHGLNNVKRLFIGSVKKIEKNAFVNCSDLTILHCLYNAFEIEESAFENCTSFIGFQDAFYRNIPFPVTKIGRRAFKNCTALTEISFTEAIDSIDESAFQDCINLENIYCNRINPPYLGIHALDNTASATIYVPTPSVEAYKTASGWSEFADRIVGYDFQ